MRSRDPVIAVTALATLVLVGALGALTLHALIALIGALL